MFKPLDRFAARHLNKRSVKLNFDRPVVSFTFDDFPRTALTNGAKILEDNKSTATFYGCLGLAGGNSPSGLLASIPDYAACASRGHEVGCHTYDHLDCSSLSSERISENLERNQAMAQDLYLPKFQHFAYPFGRFSVAAKRTVLKYYKSGRTTTPGINRGHTDLGMLKSVALYSGLGWNVWETYLKELESEPGWLIFYGHDVSSNPSVYGCTPDDLDTLLKKLLAMGSSVIPVGSALEYGRVNLT